MDERVLRVRFDKTEVATVRMDKRTKRKIKRYHMRVGDPVRTPVLREIELKELEKPLLALKKAQNVPELTRISFERQAVIPHRVRQKLGMEAGSVFAILTLRKGNIVVLKKVDSKSLQADMRVFGEVDKHEEPQEKASFKNLKLRSRSCSDQSSTMMMTSSMTCLRSELSSNG